VNISLKPFSIFLGAVCAVLAFIAIRNPVVSMMTGSVVTGLTEIILRIQDQ